MARRPLPRHRPAPCTSCPRPPLTTARRGTATLRRTPAEACTAGFHAAVRGRTIKRVVFNMDGRTIRSRTRSPFEVFVRAVSGTHRVKARVTFKDATRARTLTLGYRACVLQDHVAQTSPSVHARPVELVRARRPLTRLHTVLPVLGGATSDDGISWVHVRLPGRPNGHLGWIPTDRTRRTSTSWSISVALASRQVTVYRDGRALRRFAAVVG